MRGFAERNKRLIFGMLALVALLAGGLLATRASGDFSLRIFCPSMPNTWDDEADKVDTETYHVTTVSKKRRRAFYGAMKEWWPPGAIPTAGLWILTS